MDCFVASLLAMTKDNPAVGRGRRTGETMQELAAKTAFVTGAASGIGFALSRTFATAGMKVMLADIEPDALTAAVEHLHEFGSNVCGVACDVADPASLERAANATYEAFGNVHVCPGFVRTRIWQSGRNRPVRYGPMQTPDPASAAGRLAAQLAELGQAGLDPSDVAMQVLTAVRDNELYVFTYAGADWRAELQERFAAILAAMDKAAARQRI